MAAAPGGAVRFPFTRQRTVLIVDDEPDISASLGMRFKALGYAVLMADRGALAEGLARQYKPDLILMDLKLPDIAGTQVCRNFKADRELSKIPIILVTADAGMRVSLDTLAADDYLIKPFFFEDLQVKIRRLVR